MTRAPRPDRPDRPDVRPARPFFSSGPCAKRPGWNLDALRGAPLGRSHRSAAGKAQLQKAIEQTRNVLRVPKTHRIGIVPGSDTGAFEMAMWSLLGERDVDVLAFDSFSRGWLADIRDQLGVEDLRAFEAPYGELPDLDAVDSATRDVVFVWNGTTSGARLPHGDWIAPDRKGLTLCDATSAAFAQPLPWDRLDVVTYSWQKVLGGEAAHGMLILSERAVERLERYTPPWPLPKIFRLTKKGRLIEGIFEGSTINTPSLLCVEDYLDALAWVESLGGLGAVHARADANLAVLTDWVRRTPWVELLAKDPAIRSNTSVCLEIVEEGTDPKALARLLDEEGVAHDIAGYRAAPPGLRIWCGATVETGDLDLLLPWLDWARNTLRAGPI